MSEVPLNFGVLLCWFWSVIDLPLSVCRDLNIALLEKSARVSQVDTRGELCT